MGIGLKNILLYSNLHGLKDPNHGFSHLCEEEDLKFGLPHFYGNKDSNYYL